jgi:Ca2+-binding EF-hand superfamily protein
MLKVDVAAPSLNIVTRLVLFDKRSALTKLCMEVVAHTLTASQISSLRDQFKILDKNGTGEIAYSDLKNVLQRQGQISSANMEHMFSHDVDVENTKIKYHEFLAATLSRKSITENNMRVAFEKLSNHHEYITAENIKDLLGKDATDQEVEAMLREANLDPDKSRIDYENVRVISFQGVFIFSICFIWINLIFAISLSSKPSCTAETRVLLSIVLTTSTGSR